MVDAGLEDDDLPAVRPFGVEHRRHERARRADQVAARLERDRRTSFAPAGHTVVEQLLQPFTHPVEFDRGAGFREGGAETAAEVEHLDRGPFRLQGPAQAGGRAQGVAELGDEVVGADQVRAHVEVQAHHRRVRPAREARGLGQYPAGVRAELGRHAGHRQPLARCRLVVVDPQETARVDAEIRGDPVELVQRRRRVHRELPDARPQGGRHIGVALPGPGVQGIRGRPARVERRVQLTRRAHLGLRAAGPQLTQQRRVRVRLERVVEAAFLGQRGPQPARVAPHFGQVVDVGGGAHPRQRFPDRGGRGDLLVQHRFRHAAPPGPGRPAPCGRPSRCGTREVRR